MTTKTIDAQLLKYWPMLEKDEKQSILSVIKTFLKQKEGGPRRLTNEEYNRELDEAEARIRAGKFTSHEDVLKESESW
jgi:predicted CopG family antitoxin